MSKRRGIWLINLPLSAALDWCRETAGTCWRRAAGRVLLIAAGRREDRFEVAQLTNVRQPLQVDFCGERIELKELIKVLRIGDRIRVLCDDGVIVAEKVSDARFKLIHSQFQSEWVH